MANPKVTICIPVYNVEKFIGRCLDSVQNQTLKDIEIIVVDDCTPDKSMYWVEKRAECDSRIKIIKHDNNRGLMVARKTAYIEAKGDYIMFCDSDDTLPKYAAEYLYKKAIDTDSDMVSGNVCYINVRGIETLRKYSLSYGFDKVSIYKSLLLNEYSHNLWNKIYKRELLQNYEYTTFENFVNGEDAVLFYQLVNNIEKSTIIEDVVYNYWQNVESSTQTRLSPKRLENVIMANALDYHLCCQNEDLELIAKQKYSKNLNNWYIRGYNKDKLLDELIKKNHVEDLVDICKMINFLDFKDFLLICVKRFLSLAK